MIIFFVFGCLSFLEGLSAQSEIQKYSSYVSSVLPPLGASPYSTEKPGHDPCTRGHGYWCHNQTTAEQCNKSDYCHSVGKDPCSWGPSYWCWNDTTIAQCKAEVYCKTHIVDHCQDGAHYWCTSLWTALKCGFYSFLYCIEHVWFKPIVGNNNCTWGPAFWCASAENAQRCKAVQYCKDHHWNKPVETGTDKCDWGPGFWCADVRHAFRCGGFELFTFCYNTIGFHVHIKGSAGEDPCSQGPAFWCNSGMNAIHCGKNAVKYCQDHHWLENTEDVYSHVHAVSDVGYPKSGEQNCTWGPGFWCEDVRNALYCGFETFVFCFYHGGFHSHKLGLLGSDRCLDEAVWSICKDPYLAIKCGSEVVKFCLDNIWPIDTSTLPGGNPCSRGPSYWCQSLYHSIQCDAEDYCKPIPPPHRLPQLVRVNL